MFKHFCNKFLNFYTLSALNILIILMAEFFKGGSFFAESGLIHLFTILMSALILLRILNGYFLSDRILKNFLKIQLGALVFLSFIHIVDFAFHHFSYSQGDIAGVVVLIGYMVWLFCNWLAIEYLFAVYKHKSKTLLGSIIALIFVAVILSPMLFLLSEEAVSLIGKIVLFINSILSLLVIILFSNVKNIIPMFKVFINYTIVAIILTLAASVFENAGSSRLLEVVGVSELQIEYFSHFLIFFAQSALILGFGKLMNLPGVYKELIKGE